MRKITVIFLITSFIIYFFTSAGKTPYDYFTRLAASFLQGKVYLSENPSWLTELIPAGYQRFWVVYPPLPAILAMPFVFLLKGFQQQWLAHFLGAGIVILTTRLSFLIKKDKKLAIWVGLLAGFGTVLWFLAATGSSWYLGQITAVFFLTAALVEGLEKKRAFWVGLFLGAAYLSRIHTIVSLPVFLYLFKDRGWFKNYVKIALGILPFFIFNGWYNFIRYGVVWDKGYFLLPAVLGELKAPWFAQGVANLRYIPNNLRAALWSFPKFLKTFPFVQPSWAGLSIWITTPAFLFSFWASLKEGLVKFSWLAVLAIFTIVASHGGTGWAQFGYRFAADFYPFLFLLTIRGVAKTGLNKIHWLFLIWGILVNLWGVLWINKFGWVSF